MEYKIINGELYHYGIKGQKWGVRRYQNKDGTLTDAGKKRMKLFSDAADKADRFKKFSDEDGARLRKQAAKKLTKKEIDDMLRDEFGVDSSDKKYLKDVFEIDDPEKYVRDHYTGKRISSIADSEAKLGRTYVEISKKFRSMTVNDINHKNVKLAKQFLKEYHAGADYEAYPGSESRRFERDYLSKMK